jgi:beta-lactamase superfamily II metal-dependent hydrolase
VATLKVRVYNVRFGDAVLVTVPDRDNGHTTERHVLVDFGNVLRGEGGEDEIFGPVLEDILSVLDGDPLDLYVMTHEHMDHVQGLLFASEELDLELPVQQAWLSASAEPSYYTEHPDARRKKLQAQMAYRQAKRFLHAAPEAADALGPLLLNNDPNRTSDCVEFLRHVAAEEPAYVHRALDIDGTHPFREAKIEIWAPEEDTSIYYGSFQPMSFAVRADGGNEGRPSLRMPTPPRGVDTGAFYSLVDSRSRGVFDNLLTIDRAANNSSVVFALEWRGWRLLFPGDAEHRSWKEMDKRGLLKPVHFLKVSHHGSWNGTPSGELLEKILPLTPPDDRKRCAAVSTCEGTYSNVPDKNMLEQLGERCTVRSVEDASDELFFEITFAA